MFGIFYDYTYDLTNCHTIFIRFREFSFNMTKFCVEVYKLNVTVLKSGVKLKWSSSVTGHNIIWKERRNICRRMDILNKQWRIIPQLENETRESLY